MIKTITLFGIYWFVELLVASIIYYVACSIGMTILQDWPERLFWVAGLPVLVGLLVGGSIIYVIVYGFIWLVRTNWREAKKDATGYRGDYYE